MKPILLVLAAGMGSRYGGLKQIDPIGPDGEIIIDFSVYDAVKSGFSKVVFVIRKDIEEAFRAQVGKRFEKIIDVDYAFQEIDELPDGFDLPAGRTKPWGTGHAILMAKSVIDSPFAVINADDFYGRSGFKLISNYLSQVSDNSSYCMVGFHLGNTLSEHGTVSRGVCSCDDKSNLKEVIERTAIRKTDSGAVYETDGEDAVEISVNETVSMNMWGFTTSIFTHLENQFVNFLNASSSDMKSEFYIPSVVDALIKNGDATVKMLTSSDSWFGITYPDDKPIVMASIESMMNSGKYSQPLFS